MKTFTQSGFAFLFAVCLFLFVNESVRGQWELLLGEEGQNWSYVDMDVTLDDGLILVAYVDGEYRLLKINVLGQVQMNRSFAELDLPTNGIGIQQIKALKDGNYLLRYRINSNVEYKLTKLTPYGKTIWVVDLEYDEEVMEMESGDYWQVFTGDLNGTLESKQVVLSAIDGEDGSFLWTKSYGNEKHEQIIDQKNVSNGTYAVIGQREYREFFAFYFSSEGEEIEGFEQNFENLLWHSLLDAAVTQDEGSVLLFDSYDDSDAPYPGAGKNFVVVQKFNKEGVLEWNVEYEYSSPYAPYCNYYFGKIEQTVNGHYFLTGSYGCEGVGHPHYLWLSPLGEISKEYPYGFDGDYPSTLDDCWDCSCESNVSSIQSISDDTYIISGVDYYFGNFTDFFGCSQLPYVASTGAENWVNYYDLGNAADLILYYGSTTIANSHQGYYIGATVENNEDFTQQVYIINTNNGGKSYNNLINGQLFLDSNNNCEQEENEDGWSNSVVVSIATPEITRYASADPNGKFSVQLPNGNYTISYNLDNDLVELGCGQNEYFVNFTENYDTLTNLNFPLRAIVECPKLEVEIGTPLLRRCFKNTYKVSYCNKGTIAAEDAKITLEFPDEMIPLESSMNPTLKEGQQWTFDLGKVDIGECGFFTVTDSISCEADLGSTICLKSSVLPDDPCEAPSALWDGSNVEVTGECLGEQVRFTLKNIGSGNMNEERNYYVYENDVLTETGKIQLKGNERRQLYLNPNGRTLRLKVEQSPYFPTFNDEPQSFVEACGEGNFSYGYINSVEQNDRPPSVDIDCQEIIGSFDPNDIQVYPSGISEQHFIEANTKLTYKVRFQNTGNDTAFRVMIVDTLPRELEGESLNLGSSSHDYTFDIKFGNLLVWTFDNILLPDSTTNELESHGFVQFSISPKADLDLGTKIENKADIYFDFNAPVATNRVFNTVTDDLDIDLGEPLGVNLMDMKIEVIEGNKVQLDWWTLAESNSSFFEVERSSDGFDFEGIQSVQAQGNGEGLQHYQMIDPDIEGENNLYYRLKMVDIDGSFDYSKVVSVRLRSANALKYRVLDFNGRQILLDWMGDAEEVYTIRVYNVFGQNILEYKVNNLQTTLPYLDSGVYILQVLDGENRRVESRKVFIR
ncbi:MAG: T9SS type A sorting domain-containing protein [Chitinophagales bacterium]